MRADIVREALRAQKYSIRNWLCERYVGNRLKIGKWDDFTYSLSSFYVRDVQGAVGSYSTAKRQLNALVGRGVIERSSERRSIRYRFDRATCDRLAAEIIADLERAGLTADEPREPLRLI